jgi:hypothetical protein
MLSKMIAFEFPYSIGSADRCDAVLISVTIAKFYPALFSGLTFCLFLAGSSPDEVKEKREEIV